MPKLKTNKAAAKRIVARTKRGGYRARGMSAQHRTSGKATRVQQHSRHTRTLAGANHDRLRKLLPYL